VVRLETNWGGEGPTYTPVVEFQADNRKLEIKGTSACPPLFRVGEEVVDYYLPSRPEKAQIISTREWVVAGAFLGIGLAFILVGVILGLAWAAGKLAPQAAQGSQTTSTLH
jgi:hypothetical protein